MARRRFTHRKKMTIPLAAVAGFAPLALGTWNRRSAGPQEMFEFVAQALTGYSPKYGWYPGQMVNGTLPIMGGILIHKIAGRLGVNRLLASAGIPFIRI